jgi:hypothetical protein
MPRTFAYVRVSTTSQTTDNQIQAAGFKVEPRRVKDGAGVSALSRAFKTSRQTIMRIRDAASAA